MREENPYIGTFLLVSYVFVVFILLSSTFFSIVDAAYDEAVTTSDDESELIELYEDFALVYSFIMQLFCCPCRQLEICCRRSIGNTCRKIRKGKRRSSKIRSSKKTEHSRSDRGDGNVNDGPKTKTSAKTSSIFPSLMK